MSETNDNTQAAEIAALRQQVSDYMTAVRESRNRGRWTAEDLEGTALEVFRQMDIPLRRVEEKYGFSLELRRDDEGQSA